MITPLPGVWQQKPLLNGREVAQLLGLKQGDKSTGTWVSEHSRSGPNSWVMICSTALHTITRDVICLSLFPPAGTTRNGE